MEWIKDATSERYTLAAGRCQATVWNTERHGYGAVIKHAGTSTAQYGYATLEAAQAWCLTQLAELRAQGRCGG